MSTLRTTPPVGPPPAGSRVDQRQRVLFAVAGWRRVLGLDTWDFRHEWLEEQDAEDRPARVTAQWPYLTADFVWCLPLLAGADDEALDRVVVHELVHCLLAPLEGRGDIDELVTTWVTTALLWTRRGTTAGGGS